MTGGSGLARRVASWAVGLAAIATLIWAVLHFGDIESFGRLLRGAKPGWLIVALALQATTYVSVSLGWRAVLHRAGHSLPLRRLLPIAFSKLFADQMVPAAGMGGDILLVERLVQPGTPRGAAVAVLLVSMIGFYAAYALLAFGMLLLLWWDGRANLPIAVFVVIFLLVATAIPSLALWLRRRSRHPLSPLLECIPLVRMLLRIIGEAPRPIVTDYHLVALVAAFNALVLLADAGTMTVCLRALGQDAGYGPSFIAVLSASMVVTLGPVPMGLGSFEASATGVLKLLGIPLEAALAATLLFRAFTLWLPLLPGLISMRSLFSHIALDAPGRS
jgi:uncharacterized membrane protein YbhN (UPF0104 family)